MDGQCEKGNSDKKHKVSVGRSLTMRFSNFRSRGKAVDKCGRLTGNVMEVGRPLTTSLSMGAMDKAIQQREIGTDRGVPRLCQACSSKAWSQEVCGHEERKKCNKSCQETFCKCMRCYRKAKGRSFDGTSSYSPDSDKLPVLSDSFVGNGGGRHTGLMSVSVSGSFVSGRPAPAVPPPYLPVCVHNKDRAAGPLNKSWDRIYASRQGGCRLIEDKCCMQFCQSSCKNLVLKVINKRNIYPPPTHTQTHTHYTDNYFNNNLL